MKTVKIKWLTDSCDCETCGCSYSDGARVYLEDELILDLEPHASCFGGESWDRDEVYKLIIDKLGFGLKYGEANY